MTIVIAGGSGFLGRALQDRLRHDRHVVRVLTRRPRDAGDLDWQPDGSAGSWAQSLDGIDVVINLAGAGIANRRWTADRKEALRSSRLLATRSLVAAMQQAARPPALLVSGSAVGYYGHRGDEIVSEVSPAGSGFLADLCVAWERDAEQASSNTRVALVRTGLVMHPEGGALGSMLPPFRFGVGGRLGSGRQYMPWIHRDDWVSLVVWIITNNQARGAFNGTAPQPVTNAEFTRALGRILHRPTMLPAPGFALRVLLGEFADSLLTGQRAIPARAQEMGFTFRFGQIDAALRELL